jgi:PAS domain S-box-containing protein
MVYYTPKPLTLMDQASPTRQPDTLGRRGQFVAAAARWISLGVGLLAMLAAWDLPTTYRPGAMAALAFYAAFNLAGQLYTQRNPQARTFKHVRGVVDALSVGAGAAFSGGLASPVWLLLYPHVVAIAARGGLALGMVFGLLDALIVALLALRTPDQPLGIVHSVALLFCAFMAGTTSSHLKSVKDRLAGANRALEEKNTQLGLTLAAQDVARKEQETALTQLTASEARYRRLLERIQDGVLIIQDGRVAYANQVFADMVGDSMDALVGVDFRDLVPPEDRDDITERYTRWEQSQAVSGLLDSRILTRDGHIVLSSLRAGSVEFGGRRAIIATIRDITRQRRMEQEVKAHAERLAVINEIANAINQNLTIEDICTVVAREARRLVPFDRLTIALLEEQGASLRIVAVGDNAAPWRVELTRADADWAFRYPLAWCEGAAEPPPSRFRELLAEPRVRAVATVPLLSKDRVIGSLNLGRLEARAFDPADHAVLEPVARHIALALDNARLLDAVRRRGHEFELLLEIGRGIVTRRDLQEILPLVTRSVNRVMGTEHCLVLLRKGDDLEIGAHEGLEPEVVEGFSHMKVGDSLSGWVLQEGQLLAVADMLADPRLQFGELVQRYGYRSFLGVPLRRGAESIGTLEVLTKGEARVFGPAEQTLMTAFADQAAVAIDNARLFDEARRHLDSVVQANQQLEQLDHLRRQYLRNVSHEFRTPLTVIKGYAEFLAGTEKPPEESVHSVMKIVVESCDRVIDMVDTLIDVSRIEQEKAERALQLQRLDLKEVMEASVESLRWLADKKGIAVQMETPADSLSLQADRSLMHQVVRQLLDNALKYSASGSRVLVRAQAKADELSLDVQDFGVGIAAEHLPRIFEKFYVVDGSITRRTGGTGVGLYLVHEIVRLHQGRVVVESTPGQGSLFSVKLPRAQATAARV